LVDPFGSGSRVDVFVADPSLLSPEALQKEEAMDTVEWRIHFCAHLSSNQYGPLVSILDTENGGSGVIANGRLMSRIGRAKRGGQQHMAEAERDSLGAKDSTLQRRPRPSSPPYSSS